jgi:hypothetical protein
MMCTVQRKQQSFWIQIWVQILALPFASCVIWHKLSHIFKLKFTYLWVRDNNCLQLLLLGFKWPRLRIWLIGGISDGFYFPSTMLLYYAQWLSFLREILWILILTLIKSTLNYIVNLCYFPFMLFLINQNKRVLKLAA